MATTQHLQRLDDLDGIGVADGDPDVRGWSVRAADGADIGNVDSLIVDTDAMRVRYLDVALDREGLRLDEERHVLIPLSKARLDDDRDEVLLGGMDTAALGSMAPYRRGEPFDPLETSRVDYDAESRQFYGSRAGTGRVERRTY